MPLLAPPAGVLCVCSATLSCLPLCLGNPFSNTRPALAPVQVSTLWAGFVLAISLTEAWVKFRAPLLDRHVAVSAYPCCSCQQLLLSRPWVVASRCLLSRPWGSRQALLAQLALASGCRAPGCLAVGSCPPVAPVCAG